MRIEATPTIPAAWLCLALLALAPQCASAESPRSETGAASIYSDKLDGKSTASGERYDSHGLTAAHRTLPLGSEVRVTNLGNGRSVRVRINDRGPQVASRIIDLSSGAAAALGMRGGVARVRVDAVSGPTDARAEARSRP